MGTMPINKLLVSMSLPIVTSMLAQALYNIVDSIFLSMLNENALTAASMAFPAQMLMISVAGGTGVGMNALLSKSLGERRFNIANSTGRNGLFLAVVISVIFAVVGVLFSNLFFTSQTNVLEIVNNGTAYLKICSFCSFGLVFQMTLERLLQSTGKTFYSMLSQIYGALINVVLDPIMIFGLLGFPRMGVAGAAIATVIGQSVAAAIALYFNIRVNKELNLNMRRFKPDLRIIGRIYSVGLPSILMTSLGSVTIFGFNRILAQFTTTAVAVCGVYFRLQSFVFMPVLGLNNGMVPILAFNFGARKPERMKKTILLSVCYATGIMLTGLAAFWIFTPQLLSFFNASNEMLAIGVPALRKISLSFLFAGFCICTLSVCQALGHGLLTLVVSVLRQIVALLPAAYILAFYWGLDMVWWSFFIGEIFSLAACALFMKRIYIKEIKPLETPVHP